MLDLGAKWGYNGYMKKIKERRQPPQDDSKKDLRIYLSIEIKKRLYAYADRIGGNASSIVLGWITDKLPEAEANLGEKKEA